MFFRQIFAVFLVRTRPASSMAKPADIHITRKPPTRNEKVLKTKAVSAETSARAGALASATAARARPPRPSLRPNVMPMTFISLDPLSQRLGVGLTGADAHGMANVENKDFSIPDPAGVGRVLDGLHDLPEGVVGDGDLDFHLGKKIHRVLGPAIDFSLALLQIGRANV